MWFMQNMIWIWSSPYIYLFTEIWGIGEQIIWHHKVAISQKQNVEYSINNLVFYSDTY